MYRISESRESCHPVKSLSRNCSDRYRNKTIKRYWLMSLQPPETVRKLQEALHAKAKGAPGYRFYALYDKVYRADVLAYAYACCKANKGAAGVDGVTFEDIEAYGRERWLGELAKEPSLSGRGQPRPKPAPPVVVRQAPSAGSRDGSLARRNPVRHARTGAIGTPDAQPPVGEKRESCPRAAGGPSPRRRGSRRAPAATGAQHGGSAGAAGWHEGPTFEAKKPRQPQQLPRAVAVAPALDSTQARAPEEKTSAEVFVPQRPEGTSENSQGRRPISVNLIPPPGVREFV